MIFSESLPEISSSPLGDLGYWSSVLPLVAGGLMKVLGPYVLSEEETNSKVLSGVKKHKELVFDAIHKLLIEGRSALLGDNADLRGDENEKPPRPDKIAVFYENVVSSTRAIQHLEKLKARTKRAYSYIVGTIVVAFVGSIVGFIPQTPERIKIGLALLSILLLLSQIGVIVILRFCKDKVEIYD